MSFSTSCPACGAALTLTNDSTHVTCPYCNRDFDVDLSEASPNLKPGSGLTKEYSPPETTSEPEPLPVIPEPMAQVPADEPAAVSTPAEDRPSYAQFEPPVTPTPASKSIVERMGKWLWVLIIGLVLLCITCIAVPLILIASNIHF